MNFDNVTKEQMAAMLRERGIHHQADGEQLRVMDLTTLPAAARTYFDPATGEWTGKAEASGQPSGEQVESGMGGTEKYLADVDADIQGDEDTSPKSKKKASKK
jgi:hypothetical protein